MTRLTLYAPSEENASLREIAEKLQKLGYHVEMRIAYDVSGPVLVGPFGKVKGLKEIMIIMQQLEANEKLVNS